MLTDPGQREAFFREAAAHQAKREAAALRAVVAALPPTAADVAEVLKGARNPARAMVRTMISPSVPLLFDPRVNRAAFLSWLADELPSRMPHASLVLGQHEVRPPGLDDLLASVALLQLTDDDLRQLADQHKPAGASISDAERAAELARLDKVEKEADAAIRDATAIPARHLPDSIWQLVKNFFGAGGGLPECWWPCWFSLLHFNRRAAAPCDPLGRRASPELQKLIAAWGIPVGTQDNQLFIPNDTIRLGKSSSSESARPRPQPEAVSDSDQAPSPAKYTPLSPILTGQTNRTRED
jgi:hypothetical protein